MRGDINYYDKEVDEAFEKEGKDIEEEYKKLLKKAWEKQMRILYPNGKY